MQAEYVQAVCEMAVGVAESEGAKVKSRRVVCEGAKAKVW